MKPASFHGIKRFLHIFLEGTDLVLESFDHACKVFHFVCFNNKVLPFKERDHEIVIGVDSFKLLKIF